MDNAPEGPQGSIRIEITRAQGSVPRPAGTQMLVWPDRIEGTIGGGALEWRAMQVARQMLSEGERLREMVMPLGPGLGQCCGGALTLAFRADMALTPPVGRPLWIWGAGHVGRAIAAVMAPLPDWNVTLIDTQADRLPVPMIAQVDPVIAMEPSLFVRHAPAQTHHLILTYSHKLDLELCHALLLRDFAFAGLIGSATKWGRFRKRLAELGLEPSNMARITCPIGAPELGKHPQAIAIGVAAALMARQTTIAETNRSHAL